MAYLDHRAFIVSGTVDAFDLRTGRALWSTGLSNDDGLFDDGGVVMATSERHGLVAFAPWNYEIVVDQRSGKPRKVFTTVGPKPRARPRITHVLSPGTTPWTFARSSDLNQLIARTRSGAVAWRLTVPRAQSDGLDPVACPGGVLVPTADGSVIALTYRSGAL